MFEIFRKYAEKMRISCALFYFSLKCYSEDIDKETLLVGTPMY